MENLIIFGLGEFADVVYYYLSKEYNIVAFTVNEEFINCQTFNGKPVVSFENIEKIFPPQEHKMFIAIGYSKVNAVRRDKFLEAKNKGYKFISYVSKHAFVADNLVIGENCFIFENNTIQPFVKIGNNCIIWSGSFIAHHSIIRDHCFIGPHATIGGDCVIGEGSFIGINATLRDHIKIGKYNVIGAGALILRDTEDYEVYISTATEAAKITSSNLRRI
jgi:sugar O-acyltransferase (sialic acid O-acetyltransferase NeuD family)